MDPDPEEKTIKEGYLLKSGITIKKWKKRWFVIRGGRLNIYKSDKEYELSKMFKIKEVTIRIGEKYKDTVFKISGEDASYYIKASNKDERNSWVDALKEHGALMDTEQLPEETTIGRVRSSSHGSIVFSDEEGEKEGKKSDEKGIYSDNENEDGSEDDSAENLTPSVRLAREGVILQAYLLKLTSVRKIWKKRWVVLRLNGTFSYYKTEEEYELLNIIKIKECEPLIVNPVPVKVKGQEVYTFTLVTAKRSITFAALSAVEQEAWINEINIIRAKRKKSADTISGTSPPTARKISLNSPPSPRRLVESKHS